MKTLAVILLLIVFYCLLEGIEELQAEISILEWSLDECETGEEVYRRALEETIDPKGKEFWVTDYQVWEAARFPEKE